MYITTYVHDYCTALSSKFIRVISHSEYPVNLFQHKTLLPKRTVFFPGEALFQRSCVHVSTTLCALQGDSFLQGQAIPEAIWMFPQWPMRRCIVFGRSSSHMSPLEQCLLVSHPRSLCVLLLTHLPSYVQDLSVGTTWFLRVDSILQGGKN